MKPSLLFSQGELAEFLEQRKSSLKKEVENYDADYILNVSEEDFCQYLISKYTLLTPLIYKDKSYIYEHKEVDVDVSNDPMRVIFDRSRPFYIKGVQIVIAVPFEGDTELFYYRPSTFTFNPPAGKIVGQEIHLIYEMTKHDEEKLKKNFNYDLSEIEKYLGWVKQNVESFNNSLNTYVKQIVHERKNKLLNDLNLVNSLGIPIKRRTGVPTTYSIPFIQKKPKFEPPQVSKEPFKPEPVLSTEEYENILEMIYNMSLVMERSPRTFSKLNEEEIRDHFLMVLNANYEGQATGETFNYGGKTDILIRANNKNVFIAECKFWRGEKKFIETINQLLGYTSWRDTKTAIFLFNKNKDLTSVLEKVKKSVKSHPCYKREYSLKSDKLKKETIFSYVFHQPGDKNRELILTVMCFDVLT